MTLEEVEKQSIDNYTLNMQYLKKYQSKFHKKLELYEAGLNNQMIENKYDLEFKDGYFDILNIKTNEYLYKENSIEYTQRLINSQFNFNSKDCSFKTFYEIAFTDEVANTSKNANMFSDHIIGKAPIVHYVNKNLPKKEVMKKVTKLVIFGVGVGIHIPMLHKKVKSRIYYIVEPNLELFRLTLFTTKYYEIAIESNFVFSIAEDEREFSESFDALYNHGFVYNHYIKHFMFSKNMNKYVEFFQKKLVTQTHLTYTYSSVIDGFHKTVKYLTDEYRFLNLISPSLKELEKPILLLAAGPSLQKNIEFVKRNQNRFLIVSIYSILPYLEKYNIIPDIVIQYHQTQKDVYQTIKKIENIDIFKKSIFLFASHVDRSVVDSFSQENMFLFQPLFDIKSGFSAQTGPSIGEISYSLLLRLKAKAIYLLGIDMAFDSDTNKTHIDGYHNEFGNDTLKEIKNNTFSFRKSTFTIKGNFKETVKTFAAYSGSINVFNKITKKFKNNANIYNLSDGAYFEETTPLRIDDIKIGDFEKFDKNKFLASYHKNLIDNSEIGLNENDKQIIEQKIDEAKKIKVTIEKFFNSKDSNLEVYESRLSLLINEICYSKKICFELQSILSTYNVDNFHYIYYLLNMKGLENPKKHIKAINKILKMQLLKIVNLYIDIYKKSIE